uniref:Mitochondrial basic amino acids transporter n=1 Tax=Strigamia maritima TaxID=126957 RepID=T1IWV9_STRMM
MALDFVAGCVGGCAGVLVGYPLDTIKVRLQTQDSRCPKYKGMLDCFQYIVKKETVFGLYKGMTSPLAGVAVINALIFGVYGNVQKSLPDPNSCTSIFLAGATAGIMQSVVCCPIELVKLRMQIQEDSMKKSALSARNVPIQRYKGAIDCFSRIRGNEGMRGLYRGLGITAFREAPAFGIYFSCYEGLVTCFQEPDKKPLGPVPIILAGGLSGIMSWVFTYPIDVIKTRLQADGDCGQRQYKNTWDCIFKSFHAEGIGVFSRGLVSTVVRAFPTNAATFAAVTWTIRTCSGKPETVKLEVVLL